jgi:integrase
LKKPKFEPEVAEYLALKSKRTAQIYSSGISKFLTFYQSKYGKDKGFAHFLDRIFEEFKKPMREQSRVAEIEISQFIDYLRDRKLSNNAIRLYFAAVQNFLKYKQVTVSMSFIDIPAPTEKRMNGKHEWKIEQIKHFVDAAQSYRDKAIILCMFQSGLAVNEICNLNYGDVQDELEAGVLPVCLKLIRQKTNVEFKTFFGRDAVKYLRLYLATRSDLKLEDPLFIKERIRNDDWRITPELIQQAFSEIADKVDFVKLKDNTYNPARPHSLRAAFNSRLIGKIDETLREFWMGHAIGGVAKAYLNMPTEELRKLYMTAEEYLCIEKTSREEIEDKGKVVKLPPEVEEKIKILKDEVEKQRDEIARLKVRVEEDKGILDDWKPIIITFNELTDIPEVKELLKKSIQERHERQWVEGKEAELEEKKWRAEYEPKVELSRKEKERLKKLSEKGE